jgi:hypothetical protein
MKMLRLRLLIGVCVSLSISVAVRAADVSFEAAGFHYTISGGGKNVAFVDKATGTNYLQSTPSACASARVGGKSVEVTAAAFEGNRLKLRFGESGVSAMIAVESRPAYVLFRVESIQGDGVETLTFLNIPLTLKGMPSEPFGACALSLNLMTRVDAIPALQGELRASCERKFGLVGAKVAIVGVPIQQMLPTLQQALAAENELPICKVAGPWAKDSEFSHGSYLFNFGALTEANVDDWAAMVKSLGFTQIDNHGGSNAFFRFGDFELNRTKWPDGWDTWQKIVSRLHGAGVGSIFHTYAFFIDKQSKYVTPVPDSRLDAFRSFTLTEPISADATEIRVNESTANMSTITSFFVQNSVVLHIGDELVEFGGFSKEPPWRFTKVKRGALGTKAAAHDRGAQARHLKEMFGLFVPNCETSLFEEIAANHADVVNRAGFDGIYLDAIDGSSILRGNDECWYWASKFVAEIQKRLKKPVGMEMSSMWHHFWQYRTRWQAWDFPRRGQKRFIDVHAAEASGGLLLPLHLGWWGFWTYDPPQVEASYPDVIEHLGARLIGWDAGISLTAGVDRATLQKTPLFKRAVDTLRVCEELRHANVFDDAAKAKLRDPASDFTLYQNAAGKTRFRRVKQEVQVVAQDKPWSQTWTVQNAFASQKAKFRIESLTSADSTAKEKSKCIADLGKEPAEAWQQTAANGVTCKFIRPEGGESLCTLVATNAGQVPQNAAWARFKKQYEPLLDIKDAKALTVEIEGDGSGALVALRLESPDHLAYGAVADHYVKVDFTGRRRFTLVETESSRWSDYVWNDQKHLYHVYREGVEFGSIESLSVWVQNIPPGRETMVKIGPIVAVPLRAGKVVNPTISVNGKSIEFPVELASGSWIECNGPDDCAAYNVKGESLGKVTPKGDWPTVPAGASEIEFSCGEDGKDAARARVTLVNYGEEL